MSPDPDLNALPDQARLALSPDERTALLTAVQAALDAASVLPPAAPADDETVAPVSPRSETLDDRPPEPADDDQVAPPGPPAGLQADEVEPCPEARERFTSLSPASREGFFVVPRVPHGQGH